MVSKGRKWCIFSRLHLSTAQWMEIFSIVASLLQQTLANNIEVRAKPSKQHQIHTTSLGCTRWTLDERNNPWTSDIPILMSSTYSQGHLREIPQHTRYFTLLIAIQKCLFCFVILAGAKIKTSLGTTSKCCTTWTIKTKS